MKKLLVVSFGIAGLLGAAATSIAADAPAPKAEAPKPAAAAPEGPKVSQKAIDAGKKIDWSKMDENAKKKYMKSTVLPEMKKLFVAVDKKHYGSMNCQTCHGEKAVENKFKMPNASLPKLPQPTDRAGFMALQQKKPDVVKFMGTQVKPTMAALIGKAEWTETNPKGFGCYGCHTHEGGAAAPAPAGAAPAAPGAKPGAAAPAAPAKGGGW